jgi:ribulose-5-phosphate 4-epimerase/fuculose-1-phosphate aldolase
MLTGMHVIPRRGFLFASAATLVTRIAGQQTVSREALVDDVVTANHILAAQEIVDAFGHVSVRTAPGAARYLISRSIAPAQVTAADIMELDLDSKPVVVAGGGDKRTSYRERFIHGEIYRVRPDVMSVVHCHAPALIPFGITKVPLRPVYHNSSFVGEGVPVFEIREAGADTNMLVETPELGRALAKALGNKPAVLMRGHGAVIVGKNIIEAVARSVYLEVNARVQAQAMAMGQRVTYLDEGEVKKRSEDPDPYGRAWELWKHQAAQGVR